MVNPNLDLKSLTKPDSRRCTVLCRRQSRLDVTLGYQNVAYDVDRVQLIYATRYVVITYPFVIFVKLYYSNCRFLLLYMSSKALRSLQNASGIYGMAVASAAVEFPGQIVGHFVGGETLRAVQPKPDSKVRKQRTALREESSGENELSQQQEERGSGYGVKLAYDVPQTKFNGTLDVRVCWHSLVYLAKVDFGPKNLSF